MIDRTDALVSSGAPLGEADVFLMLRRAFAARGYERTRSLIDALCVLALVIGVETFVAVMDGAADKLLSSSDDP